MTEQQENQFKNLLRITKEQLKKENIDQIGSFNFLLVKDQIQKTKLHELLNKFLPLTGILHVHSASILDGNLIVKTAIEHRLDHLYIDPITSILTLEKQKHNQQFKEYIQLNCSNQHQIDELINKIADTFRLNISLISSQLLHMKSSGIAWQIFDKFFMNIEFMYNIEIFKQCLIHSMDYFFKEKEMSVVELRHPFGWLFDEDNSRLSIEKEVQMIYEVQQKYYQEYKGISIKVIGCSLRMIDGKEIKNMMEKIFELKMKYPELIAGFDLVGVEDSEELEGELMSILTDHREILEKKYDTTMDLFIHCGETIDPDNNNLDLVLNLPNLKRIGHGLQLIQKPHLIPLFKQKDILIEVCPLSNQLLNYTKNLESCHGNVLNQMEVNFTINSDDPTMFQTTQVDDFYYAILSWTLNLKSLKKLLENNINYAAQLSQSDKHLMFQRLEKQWALFLQEIAKVTSD